MIKVGYTYPTVEVGQVWRHTREQTLYKIIYTNVMNTGECWVEAVTYEYCGSDKHKDNGVYTRRMEDFLAKFEKVSG